MAFAQLSVSSTASPSDLVNNVLLGAGVTATNVTYQGASNARGSFQGNTSIGIKKGILLVTGDINGAKGPNDSGSDGEDNFMPGDSDLDQLTTNTTENATILEFDFVPYSDSISFKYVFGSEEYQDYVNSSYNDVFGFFLSGPGISGPFSNNSKNIALIPGTGTPVAINNVNDGYSGSCVKPGPGCESCEFYVNNCNGSSIQYDGFTTILTANSKVTCGETYHIKIAIADVGDGIYDSGVFLEAGSFKGNQLLADTGQIVGAVNGIVYESCGQVTVFFTRTGTIDTELKAGLSIAGTAINGIDYSMLPDTIIFAPFQETYEIVLNIISDLTFEPSETIIIDVDPTQFCNPTTGSSGILITIMDVPLLEAKINDEIISCPGDSVTLTAIVTGEISYTSFAWSTGDTTKSIKVSPSQTTSYFVTVYEDCEDRVSADTAVVIVSLPDPLFMTASPDTSKKCFGTLQLWANGDGGVEPYTYLWDQGVGVGDTVIANPDSSIIYRVTMYDQCGDSVSENVMVEVEPFNFYDFDIYVNKDTINEGCDSVIVTLEVSGTMVEKVILLDWISPSEVTGIPDSIIFAPGETEYSFTIQIPVNGILDSIRNLIIIPAKDSGCTNMVYDSVLVQIVDEFPLMVTINDSTFNCPVEPGDSVFITAQVSGNISQVQYLWNTGDTTSSVLVVANETTGYFVKVSEGCGRFAEDTATINIPLPEQFIVNTSPDFIKFCPGDLFNIGAMAEGGFGPPFTYSWNEGLGAGDSMTVGPFITTEYEVTVTDRCDYTSVGNVIGTVKEFNFYDFNITASKDTIMEGCDSVIITLTRTFPGEENLVYLDWSSTSTVTGVPDSILFSIGQSSVTFKIKVLPNNTMEAIRPLYIYPDLDTVCFTGISDSVMVMIKDFPPLIVTARPDTTVFCATDTVLLTATANESNGIKIWWKGFPEMDSVMVIPDKTTPYIVYVTDECGFRLDSDIVIVTVTLPFDTVLISASDDITVRCPLEPLTLSAAAFGGTGDYQFIWNSFNPVTLNPQFGSTINITAPVVTTVYTVSVRDGCTAKTAFTDVKIIVPYWPILSSDLSPDTLVCVNESFMIYGLVSGGIGKLDYDWSNGGNSENVFVTADAEKDLTITVTDSCGQKVQKMIHIDITKPEAEFDYRLLPDDFEVGYTLHQPYEVDLYDNSSNTIGRFWWTYPGPEYITDKKGFRLTRKKSDSLFVLLIVEDSIGCKDSLMKYIDLPNIFIPNAFTPNEDRKNEGFLVSIAGGFSSYRLEIFNRWGDQIFESTDQTIPWSGSNCQQDVYTYKFWGIGNNRIEYFHIGHVTLVR